MNKCHCVKPSVYKNLQLPKETNKIDQSNFPYNYVEHALQMRADVV